MALIKCPDCTADISASAKVCPKCGAQLKSNWGRNVLIILAVLAYYYLHSTGQL